MSDIPNRDELERKLARLLGRLFSAYSSEMWDKLESVGWNISALPPEIWQGLTAQETAALMPFLERTALESAGRLLALSPIGVDWALVNQYASDWARGYTFELVSGIDQTSRNAIAQALQAGISAFYEEGMTLDELARRIKDDPELAELFGKDVRDKLGRIFGPDRASMIATTEVTRAAAEGERLIVDELAKLGVQMRPIWQTNNDEIARECPICWPRHDKEIKDGRYPPGHPRCRCHVNHEFIMA